MNEWKRIFGYRRLQFFILLVFLLNGLFFSIEQENKQQYLVQQDNRSIKQIYSKYNELIEYYKDETIVDSLEKVGEELSNTARTPLDIELYEKLYEQLNFMDEYSEYLKFVQEQAKNLETISLFSNEKSFANKNIKKTASDYKKLLDVKLVLGSDEAVKSMISYTASDYFLVTLIIFICFQLLSERKKGLWDIVHTTKYGRGVLARKRMKILFLSTVMFSIAIYGTTIGLSFYYYGGMGDLGRSAQSLEILSRCPMQGSVFYFLTQYYLLKIASMFLIALITWSIISSVHNLSLGIMFFAVGIAIEYSLYRFLPVQSFMNLFKYVNIFSYIECKDIYISYLNLDLFGKAINVRMVIIGLLPILICIFGWYAIVVNAIKRPKESSIILSVLWNKIQRFNNFVLNKLNCFGLELYKILWVQKGIIILGVFAIIEMNTLSSVRVYYSPAEQIFMKYCEKMNGPYDDNAKQIIEQIRLELEEENIEIVKINEDYSNGKIELVEYETLMVEHQQFDNKMKAFSMLEEKIKRAEQLKRERNITAWIIDDIGYSRLLGSESYKRQLTNAMISILFVVLLTSQVVVYETINQTIHLVRSSERGRGTLFRKKYLASMLMTLIVWGGTYGCELFQTYKMYSFHYLRAPIQSITCLSDFPFHHVSIAGFLVILYLIKLLLLCCVASFVILISAVTRRVEHSITVSLMVMLFPSLFYYAGLSKFKFLASAIPIAGMELLQSNHGISKSILAYMVCIIIGGVSFYIARKKWVMSKN